MLGSPETRGSCVKSSRAAGSCHEKWASWWCDCVGESAPRDRYEGARAGLQDGHRVCDRRRVGVDPSMTRTPSLMAPLVTTSARPHAE